MSKSGTSSRPLSAKNWPSAAVLAAYLTALFPAFLPSRVSSKGPRAWHGHAMRACMQPQAKQPRRPGPVGRREPPPPPWGRRRGEPDFYSPRRRETKEKFTGERALHRMHGCKHAVPGRFWLTHGGDARGGRVGLVGGERRVGLRLAESRGPSRGRRDDGGTGT